MITETQWDYVHDMGDDNPTIRVTYLLDAVLDQPDYNGRDTIQITNVRVVYVDGWSATAGDQERWGGFDFPEDEALEFLSGLHPSEWHIPRDADFEKEAQ